MTIRTNRAEQSASASPTSIAVRRAERADVPAMHRLIKALADFEHLAPPTQDAQARFEQHGWPTNGSAPLFMAWIALVADAQTGQEQAAGYAITFETYSSFLARPTLYMEDVFVLTEYRRRGVGQAILQKLIEHARERDCGRMEWVVLDWNVGAQAFYQQLGARYMPEWQHYRLDIEQP